MSNSKFHSKAGVPPERLPSRPAQHKATTPMSATSDSDDKAVYRLPELDSADRLKQIEASRALSRNGGNSHDLPPLEDVVDVVERNSDPIELESEPHQPSHDRLASWRESRGQNQSPQTNFSKPKAKKRFTDDSAIAPPKAEAEPRATPNLKAETKVPEPKLEQKKNAVKPAQAGVSRNLLDKRDTARELPPLEELAAPVERVSGPIELAPKTHEHSKERLVSWREDRKADRSSLGGGAKSDSKTSTAKPELSPTQEIATGPATRDNSKKAHTQTEAATETQTRAFADVNSLQKTVEKPGPLPVVEERSALISAIEEKREHLRRAQAARKRRFWGILAAFALLPALLTFAYEAFVAVPLYEAKSVVVVSKANSAGEQSVSGMLGVLGGGGGTNINEAFMAREYVLSKVLLDDLEAELGLISRLASDEIDPLRRLQPLDILGLNELMQFRRFVRASVNLQTGLMTLYVRAPSEEDASDISQSILALVENRVNLLSDALFRQQIESANVAVDEARHFLIETQTALTSLQIESGEANPEIRVNAVYESMAAIEAEIREVESQIEVLEVADRSESIALKRAIAVRTRLKERLAETRKSLLQKDNSGSDRPLSALLLDYQRLKLEMEIGQESLTLALASLDQARSRATLGRSQFQVVVPPVANPSPWRPLPLSNALLVFLVAVSVLATARLFRSR